MIVDLVHQPERETDDEAHDANDEEGDRDLLMHPGAGADT